MLVMEISNNLSNTFTDAFLTFFVAKYLMKIFKSSDNVRPFFNLEEFIVPYTYQ